MNLVGSYYKNIARCRSSECQIRTMDYSLESGEMNVNTFSFNGDSTKQSTCPVK